jgi:heat shock protein HtpX
MVTARTWLVARVVLALVLMVSFYVLAIGVALLLLVFAYTQVVYLHLRVFKLILFCIAGALTILWSLIPRRDRFVPPGPQVAAQSEPALFDMLRAIASSTDQPMPAEVYIVPDVNAFVAQRGGMMGVGTRRVMGLGLPLLQAVTVQELKAILAHEFGHYHAGDVALGPWIHRTRAAMERTIRQLSGNRLQHIFIAYGKLFLRVTHAVSRRQEFIADELAARVAGGRPLASALRKAQATAPAFIAYWTSEVMPVIGSGYLPPVMNGFAQFVEVKGISDGMKALVAASETESSADPYDTHPPLKQRLAALAAFPESQPADDRPATALLSSLDSWETQLLSAMFGGVRLGELKRLDWPAVVERVYVPGWRKVVADNLKIIEGLTLCSFPLTRAALIGRGRGDIMGEDRIAHATQIVVTALALSMVDAGWQAESRPGRPVVLRRAGAEPVSFGDLVSLVSGEGKAPVLGLPPDLRLVPL